MICFGKSKKNIFHLNARAAYVIFYVGNIDKVEDARVDSKSLIWVKVALE